jgi:multiple antibiotic resistance protein
MFLMLGPFKIIAPFLKVTRGTDAAFTRRIAFRSTLFASLALLVAAFLGNRVLSSYGIPLPILSLAAGIILFLVALQTTLAQFAPVLHGEERAEAPNLTMALTPLAFPAIVTPYGIASLVVFLEVAPDTQTQLAIGAVLLAIMLLNLLTMLLATRFMGLLYLVLPILGAILGVVQVALGLQIIYNSLKALGVL